MEVRSEVERESTKHEVIIDTFNSLEREIYTLEQLVSRIYGEITSDADPDQKELRPHLSGFLAEILSAVSALTERVCKVTNRIHIYESEKVNF